MPDRSFNDIVHDLREIVDVLEESIHAKFMAIDKQFDKLERSMASCESDVSEANDRTDDIEEKLEDVDSTASSAYERYSSLDDRCDDIDTEISDTKNDVDKLQDQISDLESTVSDIILIEGVE